MGATAASSVSLEKETFVPLPQVKSWNLQWVCLSLWWPYGEAHARLPGPKHGHRMWQWKAKVVMLILTAVLQRQENSSLFALHVDAAILVSAQPEDNLNLLPGKESRVYFSLSLPHPNIPL